MLYQLQTLQEWGPSYTELLQMLRDLSAGLYREDAYEEALAFAREETGNFKKGVLEVIEEACRVPLDFKDKKELFQIALGYGFLEPIKLLLRNDPGLLEEKYGDQYLSVSDFTHKIIAEYKNKELFDKSEFVNISAGFKETLDYFIKERKILLSQSRVAEQIIEGVNPRESVENKAVLVSVQNSIENLLKKYNYLAPGAKPPAKTSFYNQFKSWIESSTQMDKAAAASFEAVLHANTDIENYMDESVEKNRQTLYGSYRFVVRETKKKFTMPDVFVLIWQAIQTEAPDALRAEYLGRWALVMQEAAYAHNENSNPVFGFEGTTIGCSNAMVNPSVAILATIEGLSKEVQVHYANSQTMTEKAFHGFFADKIEEQWNTMAPSLQAKLRQQIERWILKPQEGIPDALYTEEVKQYIVKKLKEEYQTLMTAMELNHNIEEIIENLTYRIAPPRRVKQLLLQSFVEDFVKEQKMDVPTLNEVLRKTKLEKATPESIWGGAVSRWTQFLEVRLKTLLPTNTSQEERLSYKNSLLEAIRNKLLQLVKGKGASSSAVVPTAVSQKAPNIPGTQPTVKSVSARTAPAAVPPKTGSRTTVTKGKNTGT